MVKFGPAGNCDMFYNEGHKHTTEAPEYVSSKGATAYEYSFGRGINVGIDKLTELGKLFKQYGVEVSVHAPYYINLANPDDEMAEKSIMYVINSLKALRALGGHRCVFHAGSCGKLDRETAFGLTKRRMVELVGRIKSEGLDDMYICPETMGKTQQIGTYQEIAELCTIDDIVIPAIDFGHVNALTQGSLKTEDDYKALIDYMIDHIGRWKVENMHVHFSKIEYGPKGEIKHLTFEDQTYGPEYEPLARVIKKYKLSPVVICESRGTQLEDCLIMKNIQENID